MKIQKATVTQTQNIQALKGRGVSHKLSLMCPRSLFFVFFVFLNEQSDK